MRKALWLLIFSSLIWGGSPVEEAKMHALFLMQQQQFEEAMDRYLEACEIGGRQDFSLIQQMGLVFLQKGIQELDPQNYLMTLYGAGISGSTGALEILSHGLFNKDPQIQLLSLHFISQFDDDRATELLNEAMSSDFLSTRMEAAFYLSLRKHPHATGQIEGLMYRLPPVFKPYFAPFFALIGTHEATSILKRLAEDIDPQVRIETILNIGKMGRDDFLPMLRKRLSHSHIAELEATAFAIGALKDSFSLSKLSRLATSPTESVRLSAILAELQLGCRDHLPLLFEMAKKKNLFAIFSLGTIPESESILASLLKDTDLQVRVNASLALLQRRDARALPMLKEILIRDHRDFAYQPLGSLGRTLVMFKAVPSAELRSKDPSIDLSYSTTLKEQFLKEAIHLPEKSFIELAQALFDAKQNELIPTLITLLENLRSPAAIELLKRGTEEMTSPLIRDYCHLALYRLKEEGPYEAYIKHWVTHQKETDLIRLRPLLPLRYRIDQIDYTLSTEETSRLLIDTFLSIAAQRDEKSISFIINAIQLGNPSNRYALMGLLMRSTE